MIKEECSLILAGKVSSCPMFSHKTHDFTFIKFTLAVARLSGVRDDITVLTKSDLVENLNLTPGIYLEIEGDLRSYNNKSGVGNKLVIYAFAKKLKIIERANKNDLRICCTICKSPVFRRTPLGREICDLMVSVNRSYGRVDYLPCIAWGKNAQFMSQLSTGASIEIYGRIQSREYIKQTDSDNQVRTAYEISISSVKLQNLPV